MAVILSMVAVSVDPVSLAIGIGVGVMLTLFGIWAIFRDASPRPPW